MLKQEIRILRQYTETRNPIAIRPVRYILFEDLKPCITNCHQKFFPPVNKRKINELGERYLKQE